MTSREEVHSEPVLRASGLGKEYPGIRALTDVSLELGPGQVLGLVGHNGAGKSTLTRILGGVERPTEGELWVGGTRADFSGPQAALAAGIAVVPQHLNVVPNLTVAENLVLGRRRPAGLSRKQARADLVARLTSVGMRLGLGDVMREKVRACSPSVQRLVMIGRALLNDPVLIILDEPTAALHPAEADRMFAAVEDLRQAGMAVIFISHRLDEVLRVCTDVVALRQGAVLAAVPASEVTREDVARLIAGGESATLTPGGAPPGVSTPGVISRGAPVLECVDVVTPSLRGVSLSGHAGEILGLAGLQSSGSSAILKVIAGLAPDAAGDVRVAGRPVGRRRRDAIRSGIAYLPDDRLKNGIVRDLSVAATVTLSDDRMFRIASWLPVLRTRNEARKVNEVLTELNIRPARPAGKKIQFLSGGNQQKALMARAMLSRASVYLFDEPTEGVDVGAKRELHRQVTALAEGGATVLVSSSEPEELVELCHRVLVFSDGVVVSELSGDRLTEANIIRSSLAGTE